ncbi:S9 family peptidase [Phytoactinopolyspora halotolerans]|uniref:S9 family peptidase n=1 Tax=Phytoactinopolyspora halotolerans TaxID=1981512 RepID=A0A6L9S120_9ACTN|nr:S9 family peptidase [Phytoactinopolyspora halotolerans]NED98752.1 S9 family peptidase [Phytoactinopolyspora halotolerans]
MSDADHLSAPVAKRVPRTRTFHGDEVVDEYFWLLDRDDPDTIAYLEAENAYTEAVTAHTKALQDEIFSEIKARTLETDLSVPAHRGGWWYYTRTVQGQQYAIHCRSRSEPELPDDATQPIVSPDDEQVLLDENELAGDSPYFALGAFDVSPDGRLLVFSTDFDGSEKYTLRVKDLERDQLLPDSVPDTYYSTAWSADGSTVFYTTVDEAMRPYRVWRHRLGTQASEDQIVHQEDDERFFADVDLTRSEAYIVISLGSSITSEVRVLPADAPGGEFQVLEPRRQGVEYTIDHSGGYFFIVHNDGAMDFELAKAPVASPGREHWSPVLPHEPGRRVVDVHAFAGHLVVALRRDGGTGLHVIPLRDGEPQPGHDIGFAEEVRTVRPGGNPEFDTDTFRLGYTSLATPSSIYDHNIQTRELRLRKRQPVLGDFDPEHYQTVREWATAEDGTEIPISLVRHRDTPADGTAPCVLYGYGSYEASMDPWFSIARLSLLDRGFVFAIAHVRGGGEMGRAWYEQGKMLAKRNTFTDFVACAQRLVAAGWTSHDRLVGRGGSAGGLLIGAVANLAPSDFAALVGEVPFVDALNTILDPSLPLTVIEWEEWGNPVESAEVYRYMKSYSPYENVQPVAYPAILATAGLNDPRVGYHEPAKWVAKLRATATGDRSLLLKTEMGAGHRGPSGRYDAWREEAFTLAFVIDSVPAVKRREAAV